MNSVVLIKSDFVRIGGLEKWGRALLHAFLDKGYNVTLLTTGEPGELPSSVKVHSLKSSLPISFLRVKAFDRFCLNFLKDHPSELIFGLDRTSFQTHLRAGNGVHRVFLQQRSRIEGWKALRHQINPLHKTLLALEKKAFEYPGLRKLYANSEMVRQNILSHYKVDPAKIEVIHNGVEWQALAPVFEERNRLLPSSHFELLFVGNGFRRKGLHRLLEGLAYLNTRGVHLSIVGKDKEMGAFIKLAQKLSVSATFYGQQKDMRPFYQRADALAIPSYYDPFANSTIEALACGVFVVSSHYNGGSEILQKRTGCLIENLDKDDSVAEALQVALQHPKTAALAAEIRSSVQSLDITLQLQKYLDSCLNESHKGSYA